MRQLLHEKPRDMPKMHDLVWFFLLYKEGGCSICTCISIYVYTVPYVISKWAMQGKFVFKCPVSIIDSIKQLLGVFQGIANALILFFSF